MALSPPRPTACSVRCASLKCNPSIVIKTFRFVRYISSCIMNMYALPAVVGFLVQDDGMCRTYKATRQPESIMYEQNDLVHVSQIAEVIRVH
mmetsp:Transcript_22957/g.32958  ORF Transcript_22957/g.32958 Transcript_22957/m.32958 type:complete len:92 (+) Transcript_22957:96-371(+)